MTDNEHNYAHDTHALAAMLRATHHGDHQEVSRIVITMTIEELRTTLLQTVTHLHTALQAHHLHYLENITQSHPQMTNTPPTTPNNRNNTPKDTHK